MSWTDDEHGLKPQPFSSIDYHENHTYWTTITHSTEGGGWWMCALDTANTDTYTCQYAPKEKATGTRLKDDPNTSIWAENFNKSANWHDGFSSEWVAHGAATYVGGIGHPWSDQRTLTGDACSNPWLPSNAIYGTLKEGGNASFWTDGIPLYCESTAR